MADLGTSAEHGIDLTNKDMPLDYYMVDQNWDQFTSEEHGTWGLLYERMRNMLPGYACKEYLKGLDDLDISKDEIPDFRRMSERLKSLTGWEVVAVPGMIPDKPFFKMLANRQFPSGDFIRPRASMDYIKEPDVFHDGFGHVPLLSNPVFADYMQAYGEAGQKAMDHKCVNRLLRLYWFTVEFGLIQTDEGIRIYGAGILSSSTESKFALKDDSPNRLKFDVERIMRTKYKYDDLQQTYFVIDSFEQLFKDTAEADFTPLYEGLLQKPQFEAAEITADDVVLHKGTGAYAKEKAAQEKLKQAQEGADA